MKQKITTVYSILLIGLFLIVIAIPFTTNILDLNGKVEISKSENRALAKKPVADINKLDPFPQAYELWFNDHFFKREQILTLNNYYKFIFGKSPMPENVLLGKDNWLYYNVKERDLYEGKFSISNDSMQLIVNELIFRVNELSRRNIKFYLFIAPTKAEIYPEYLPNYIQRTSKTATDKILERIKSHQEINLITCKEELLQAKKSRQVYFKYDNHWNDQGAFVAYNMLIHRIGLDFPAIKPTNNFRFETVKKQGGNLANMIGLDYLLSENTQRFTVINSKSMAAEKGDYPFVNQMVSADEYHKAHKTMDTLLPRVLVFRDSFFEALLPMVSENFNRSVFIFDSWRYQFNLDIIEAEKPDIVILEIYEPHISNILHNLTPR